MLYGLSLLAGIVLLTLGGESLIRGAVAGARQVGVSPLLTGLVVSFGTSAPQGFWCYAFNFMNKDHYANRNLRT